MTRYNLFPNAKHLCLTMSFDDGRIYDRRLVEIFNKYGIKGTFHLCGRKLDQDSFVTSKEVKELYEGHEVSCHGLHHPFLDAISDYGIIEEILEDRRTLESLVGYPVRGLSYPYGTYDERVIEIIKRCGIEYSRTTVSTNKFLVPKNYLEWHPTLHIKTNIDDKWNEFLYNRFSQMKVFYIWGHSYEFNNNDNWDLIEDFCKLAGNHPDVWYATNIEIVDYLEALKQLKISVDETVIVNPTIHDLWISKDKTPLCIKANSTWREEK
jgi:peptidoglycan/xylan/chitin deacetylase (PgdA/CDA1 family)